MEYSQRIVDAFALCYELHRTQIRKGSHVPYITHLMGVAAIVGRHGGNEEQFIAALLHDAVEDQGGQPTLDRIRAQFGKTIAGYVEGCSDSDIEPKPPWRERKEKFVEATRHAAPELKLIIAADKLHNIRSTLSDLCEHGPRVWRIFKGGKEGCVWYHRAMLQALRENWDHPLLRELADAVDALEAAPAPPDTPPQ